MCGNYLSFRISPPSLLCSNMVSGCRVKNIVLKRFILLSLADLRLRVLSPFSGLWAPVCILCLPQLTMAQLWPDLELRIQYLPPSYPLGLLFERKNLIGSTQLMGWFLLGQVSTGSQFAVPGHGALCYKRGPTDPPFTFRNCEWCSSNFMEEALTEINTLKRV